MISQATFVRNLFLFPWFVDVIFGIIDCSSKSLLFQFNMITTSCHVASYLANNSFDLESVLGPCKLVPRVTETSSSIGDYFQIVAFVLEAFFAEMDIESSEKCAEENGEVSKTVSLVMLLLSHLWSPLAFRLFEREGT